jgi:hypothetical protein
MACGQQQQQSNVGKLLFVASGLKTQPQEALNNGLQADTAAAAAAETFQTCWLLSLCYSSTSGYDRTP